MSSNGETADGKSEARRALSRFKLDRLLTQDQAGRRIALLGTIDEKPAVLLAERAAFAKDEGFLLGFASSLEHVQNLGVNDIYSWFMASSSTIASERSQPQFNHDLKINLIWPCTQKHITKYSEQGFRCVTETPQIYRDYVRPYMQRSRDAGHLNWIYDILEGRAEQEDVMHRRVSEANAAENEGFMLLPDLNWDRKTISSLHCLGICERRDLWSVRDLDVRISPDNAVKRSSSLHCLGICERRDLWSVRDLCKKHVPWLKHMRQKLLDATTKLYPTLEEDQLKLYVHYQPTYYHFHIHVVNVLSDPGKTQAVGKALGLNNIIDQLELMSNEDDGMQNVTLTYDVGEASELWLNIFEPLKREKLERKHDQD